MAFIRQYMAEAGDPGRFKLPKRLRKLKVGRALGSIARVAVGFVPGVGPLASKLSSLLERARAAGVPEERLAQAADLARSYGIEVGDPGPAPKPANKRKRAGAGTKAKAKAKAKGKPKGPGLGGIIGSNLANAAGSTVQLGKDLTSGDFTSAFAKILHGGPKTSELAAAFGGKGHRRHMNPANVHALRRSIRRVEGFEKLARKVLGSKMYRHRAQSVRHGAGHRAGCKCAVCRRAA